MRKGGMTARVAAAILAAAMVMTDAVPAFAAENLTVETTEQGAVSGVSKVIGLEGKYSSNTLYSDDNKVEKDYAYVNPALRYENDRVTVTGTKESWLDAATGLYKKGDIYYANFNEYDSTLSGKVAKVYPATAQPQEDATGFYDVDGKKYPYYDTKYQMTKNEYGNEVPDYDKVLSYYFLERDEVEVLGAVPGGPFADYDALESAVEKLRASYAQKVSAADANAKYYLINGKTYTYDDDTLYYKPANNWNSANDTYTYTAVAYVRKDDEISFDRKYHNISWNKVTNETEVESGGKLLKVGYQVKVDGQAVELGDLAVSQDKKTVEPIQTGTTYSSSSSKSYTAAEKAKYEVRAVYYTETIVASDEYSSQYGGYYREGATAKQIVKTGAWSELTYNWSQKQVNVPVVTGLKWVQKNAKTARISWNAVPDASYYKVQSYKSTAPVNVTALKDEDWTKGVRTGTRTYYDYDNSDLGYEYEYDEDGNIKVDADGEEIRKEFNYIYFRVCAVVKDSNENEVEGAYCAPCAVTANRNTNAPVASGLKIENNDDGTFRLVWNPVDVNANVRVLYSKSEKIFQSPEYTYMYREAAGVDSLGRTQKLTNITALKDKMELVNKQVEARSVSASQNYISSEDLDLEPGKKYYFVVLTYDTSKHDDIRTPLTTQNVMVNGKAEPVQFVNYNDVSVSGRISATLGLGIDAPTTKSGKKSITMIFNQTNSAITGYEIYRKNGKNYKKVKTISSTEYTDEGLKESTVYDYRARAYYYNPETKAKKVYSDYVYFSAETGNSNYIDLRVTKKSKTSATLKWTKVSGATQYDIYRAYLTSTDTNLSKSNGFGNYAKQQSNKKFELVKTIKKAKTVSWTDKKLKQGVSYTYVVVASYKSKKVTKQIYAMDSVVMKVEAPKNVKTSISGTNVKVTWDKDKFATKYEVSYKKYDNKYSYDGEYYSAYEDHWTTANNVKKNSYTIKNVAGNEAITIRVRAYGNGKWSDYVTVYQNGNEKLKVAQSVTAKEVTEKNAQGVSTTAVKISWKKVSGAKYYKVWRSTSPASFYNADKKSYETNGRVEPIAKESNNDESTYANVVPYKEYKAQENTIVATSAIDRGNLRTGVTYYYYVQAFGENGDTISGYSKPASICYKISPSIKKLTAKKGKVTISITKVNGASKYEIYRSTKKNSGFEKIGTTKKNATSFVDKTVKKGKKYYYKVVAIGTNGLKADFASGASKVKSIKAK